METKALKTPLTNAQITILGLFSHEMNENDLIELKRLLVNFLAKKLTILADVVWLEKKWTDDDMDNILSSHLRTPYISK